MGGIRYQFFFLSVLVLIDIAITQSDDSDQNGIIMCIVPVSFPLRLKLCAIETERYSTGFYIIMAFFTYYFSLFQGQLPQDSTQDTIMDMTVSSTSPVDNTFLVFLS